MNCLIVQPIHEAGLAALQEAGITPVLCPSHDMATVARHMRGIDAVITRDAGLDAAAFAAADRLKVVIVHGTGHDPVDKAAATYRGVIVGNTPGANARSVAELAVGLVLAVARRIPAADRAMRECLTGFRESVSFSELCGGTALIVGWGAIGRETGRMLAQAFDMQVLVHSPRAPQIEGGEPVASLYEGLARADLVSLHTPLREETRHMIDACAFAAMRPGAILINMARAGLVDEAALFEAVASGHLGGAGLDVCSLGAPTGPLAQYGNIVFTPHLGGTTEEALRRVALEAVRHVRTALAGRIPDTALNPDVWGFGAPGLTSGAINAEGAYK